jgi:hypothetical protein
MCESAASCSFARPAGGEDRIGDAPVARAGRPLDPTGPFEAVQEPGHPGGGQDQLFGEVDPPHPALFGMGQEKEAFVVVDRQPVLGHELGAHGTGRRGVPPEEAHPGIQGRSLIGQYLTRQCFLATIACVLNYSLIKEECK